MTFFDNMNWKHQFYLPKDQLPSSRTLRNKITHLNQSWNCIWLFLMHDVQQRVRKGNRKKRRTKLT